MPDVVAACQGAAGLSLGEYTALVFAGAIEFEAGLEGGPAARSGDAGRRDGRPERHGERSGPR